MGSIDSKVISNRMWQNGYGKAVKSRSRLDNVVTINDALKRQESLRQERKESGMPESSEGKDVETRKKTIKIDGIQFEFGVTSFGGVVKLEIPGILTVQGPQAEYNKLLKEFRDGLKERAVAQIEAEKKEVANKVANEQAEEAAKVARINTALQENSQPVSNPLLPNETKTKTKTKTETETETEMNVKEKE